MLEEIMVKQLKGYLLFYVMGGIFVLGVFLRLFLVGAYRRYIRASDEIGTTRCKWIRQMKQRFEALYKLKIGINDVDVYVKKHVLKTRFCGILLTTWEKISGQAAPLCLLIGSVGGIGSLIFGLGQTLIILHFFFGIWAAALLAVIQSITGLKQKKAMLLVGIKDYFENNLKIRLEKEYIKGEHLDLNECLSISSAEAAASSEKNSSLSEDEVSASKKRRELRKERKSLRMQEKRRIEIDKREKEVMEFERTRLLKAEKEERKRAAKLDKERAELQFIESKKMEEEKKREKRETERMAKRQEKDNYERVQREKQEVMKKIKEAREEVQKIKPEEAEGMVTFVLDKEEVVEEIQVQAEPAMEVQTVEPVKKRTKKPGEELLVEDVLREFLA